MHRNPSKGLGDLGDFVRRPEGPGSDGPSQHPSPYHNSRPLLCLGVTGGPGPSCFPRTQYRRLHTPTDTTCGRILFVCRTPGTDEVQGGSPWTPDQETRTPYRTCTPVTDRGCHVWHTSVVLQTHVVHIRTHRRTPLCAHGPAQTFMHSYTQTLTRVVYLPSTTKTRAPSGTRVCPAEGVLGPVFAVLTDGSKEPFFSWF